MDGMTRMEQKQLVNRYIGVSGGYLGDFSYSTHSDFYPEYCDLDIDPNEIQATTRVRFETILERSPPDVQAKIVRGILKKYPPIPGHELRTQDRHDEFMRVAQRLESASAVNGPAPVITSAIVEHTIADAETLIKTRGATSGVDRIHTMLHGYMRAVCDHEGIPYAKDDTIGALWPRHGFLGVGITAWHVVQRRAASRAEGVTNRRQRCPTMRTGVRHSADLPNIELPGYLKGF
jgi:hypothetical protein